jgi:hypothetical protein
VHVAVAVHGGAGQPFVVRLTDEGDGQCCARTLEDRAVLGEVGLEGLPAVVEAGCDVDLERHRAADAAHQPDQLVAVRGDRALDDRHEVDDLADPGRGHEPGDQHGGVRQVQLLGGDDAGLRADPEVAATLLVQQRAEDAR